MKSLVLTEKPSVAREIARVLGCAQKQKSYFEGPRHVVTWALGHLVELAEPEDYDKKYGTWKLEDLPLLPQPMKLKVIRQTSHQFKAISHLAKRGDLNELVIATDAGREGELVARWIMELVHWQKPFRRLWISSQTDKAIKEGFANLRPGNSYDNLFDSAVCRAEADWLIGLNITRALTCKYNAQLSAGRVQTPTLAAIVRREQEICNFKPVDYWTVEGDFGLFRGLCRKEGVSRYFDKSKAEAILNRIQGKTGIITGLKTKEKVDPQPLPHDLTELQREANRRYGFSAKQTASVLQRLYEQHKLVTYPRTDSRHLTSDMANTLQERLAAIAVGPYAQLAGRLLPKPLRPGRRVIDDSKVTDHHAIIPTGERLQLQKLTADEARLFDLIARRYIALFYPPCIYEEVAVTALVAGEEFRAKGRAVKEAGWKQLYDRQDPEDETEQQLPQLEAGQKLLARSCTALDRQTQPPARYTEATLLTAMEHPGKFIENDRLRETVDKSGGLGTPATRADIIEKLFDCFYMERRGKEIVPTSKGIQLVGIVPGDLKSPELTAKWEQQLTLISRGKADPAAFVSDMRHYASKLVSAVVAGTEVFRHDNVTREKCPQCGKYLLEVNGKRGKMLVCQDRECGYRRGVSIITNARCPECHKKMEIRGEGKNKGFFCSCGYREKLEAFNKRKGEHVDKREVSRFLNQQQDEGINSALADALAKLKK